MSALLKCRKFLLQNSSETNNIAAIFFDLDNTLIPTRKGDAKACRKLTDLLVKQHGINREKAEVATETFLQSFRSCPDNPQTTLDSWRSYLWSQALPNSHKHLSEVIYKNWLQLRYRYLALTADYENMLKQLRHNHLLALITNGPSNGQWEKINQLNLSQYFDCILVSSDMPWEKPNPHIFLAACNILNVKPQNCIMIGDKLETDIQGGKDANLGGTVWIPLTNDYNTNSLEPKPDVIVDNLLEIFKYLPSAGNSGGTGRFSDVEMDDGTSSGGQRRRRSNSQSTAASTSFSQKYSSQYRRRRHVSFPEIDFNDNSCDCS